jgi:ABC-type polysaccharide/polyol phosphate transport system ATPase subunit
MMLALRAHDLGKKYEVFRRPADRLKELLWAGRRSFHHDVWALRHVYLEVPRGATWGIIGPNGAGKSTFLKIVTGTTRPTCGTLEVNGSVSGILDLGQGFEPDFSGRSNVLMNCSILGMSRAEAMERFESIVDFAELWAVIDQPVRTYSSGMYLRLAFAVAVSLEPDILVVDEALAVGDEYFRGKCYARINDFRRRGKTILFVSHSLGVVRHLCDRVVLLKGGEIAAQGRAEEVADQYLRMIHEQEESRIRAADLRGTASGGPRWGDGRIEVREVRTLDASRAERHSFVPGETLTVEARFRVKADVERPVFGVGVFRSDGTYLCGVNHLWHEQPIDIGPLRGGETGRVRCTIDPLPLLNGTYYLSYFCYDHSEAVPVALDHQERVKLFQVVEGPVEMHGTVALPTRWEIER